MSPSPFRMVLLLTAEALSNLWAVAQRSMLALIGIIIGTGSVIAMLNVGHNAELESIRQFKAMGTDLIVAQGFGSNEQVARVEPAMIEDIPASLPSLRRAAPVAIAGMRLGRREGLQSSVIGTTASLQSVLRLKVAEGRFFSPFDRISTYAIVGAQLARSPELRAETPLGPNSQIRIGSYLFTVVGVLEASTHNPLLPFDLNMSVFIPLDSMRRVTPGTGDLIVLAAARDGKDPVLAAEDLGARLGQLQQGRPVQTQSARQLIEGMQRQARIMAGLLATVGGISLLVGGVGVMNVMLMNVAERRREIGLRLALGARRRYIQLMFLIEATLLSAAGGILGTALGTLMALLYARYSGSAFVPSPLALPLGAVISAGVGIFFGAYPAASAARLDPIETLRAE